MTVRRSARRAVRRYGTPAALASQTSAPQRSQADLRERRHKGLTVMLDGRWSLTDEIESVCEPLARRIAASERPARFLYTAGASGAVDWMADAAHMLCSAVVALLARADAERRCAHLGVDERGRSVRALIDLAQRPKLPKIGEEAVAAGTWAATLVALARPYSDQLSALLGNAATTAVSDRLRAALTDFDRAALALERRLDRAEAADAQAATRTAAQTPTDRARAELAALGISTT